MRCPKCGQEMRFFKNYITDESGYQCQRCGAKKILTVIEIDPVDDEDALEPIIP